MSKVTLAVAAKEFGLHPNTFKNWIRAGKIPSAEKQKLQSGAGTWLVDLEEVRQVIKHGSPVVEVETNDQAGPAHDNLGSNHTTYEQTNQTTSDAAALAFRESIIAPLTEVINQQRTEIAGLQERIADFREDKGRLEERIKSLEERLAAALTAPGGAGDSQTVQPSNTPAPGPGGPPASSGESVPGPVKRGWWARLFGGG